MSTLMKTTLTDARHGKDCRCPSSAHVHQHVGSTVRFSVGNQVIEVETHGAAKPVAPPNVPLPPDDRDE